MIRNKVSPDQNQAPFNASREIRAAGLNQSGVDFAPSAEEVASRAHLRYGNRTSWPAHAVEHWLEAESQLLVERGLAR